MAKNRATRIVKFTVIGILALGVFGFLVMTLWNWLMPAIFGLKAINFWQALGLVILSKILFGGIHSHGRGHKHGGSRMRERWENMTPEEREKFREGIEGFCGPAKERNA